MPPTDPWLARANQLLADTLHQPVPRARRIAGLYAALYLEDPLLNQWAGLAAFVARHIYLAMESTSGTLQAFMGRGNLDIYQAIMPALLRQRAGQPEHGPLQPAFELLAQAHQTARSNLAQAQRQAADGMGLISQHEQSVIVQPAYDDLGGLAAHMIAPLMRFRLGFDSASRVITFDGDDAREVGQRLNWVRHDVLPAWRNAVSEHPELLRAEIDRLRRWAGIRGQDLEGAQPAAALA